MPSPHLLETIRLTYGTPQNLSWHTDRLNRTRRELFGLSDSLDLESYLQRHTASLLPNISLAKLRLIYNDSGILSHEVSPYVLRMPQSFSLTEAQIDYPYKYADRSTLDRLVASTNREIIITTNGYLRDTPIANIALRRHGIWYTPATPLLPGTTRARLLTEGSLHPKEIHQNTLLDYDRFALMNAMIGFVDLPTSILTKEPISDTLRYGKIG